MCQKDGEKAEARAEPSRQEELPQELLKWKGLFQEGIIMEEEFEAKKRELLGGREKKN